MKRKKSHVLLFFGLLSALSISIPAKVFSADVGTELLRAAGIGLVVTQAAPGLNRFINTITFRNGVPKGTLTKVVPILSVGEKGYAGAAQVIGPAAEVKSVKAVWQYEDNFSKNEFRLKILVPSSSLNPLALRKVQKVGVSAMIDVSLDGRWKGQTFNRSIGTSQVIKAAAVAVAVNAAADPLNRLINGVTGGLKANTKVVPIITVGDKAYVGGVQVSGPAAAVRSVKAAYQYDDIFDNGRFRIKAFVPSNSVNPLKISRVNGVGISALIDTSIAEQRTVRQRQTHWRRLSTKRAPMGTLLNNRFREDHDQGRHLGWYIGKGNQRKRLDGVWVERYRSLGTRDQEAFVGWWNKHHKDDPKALEKRWQEWKHGRSSMAEDKHGKSGGGAKQKSSGKGRGK